VGRAQKKCRRDLTEYSYQWSIVMPDKMNFQEQKRSKKKRAVTLCTYNPVNMAGKPTRTCEQPIQEDESVHDDYNPVNMAGKQSDATKK
jgi:hypothetical protein